MKKYHITIECINGFNQTRLFSTIDEAFKFVDEYKKMEKGTAWAYTSHEVFEV